MNISSTCPVGREQWELVRTDQGLCIKYEYQDKRGHLYRTVAPTLAVARQKRDRWLEAEQSAAECAAERARIAKIVAVP